MEGLCEGCANRETTDQPVLLTAAELGHHKCIEALLSLGTDVNLQNQTGYTPLMWAVKMKHHSCVDVLMKAAADVNIGDIRAGPDPGFSVGGAWTHFRGVLASNVGTFM